MKNFDLNEFQKLKVSKCEHLYIFASKLKGTDLCDSQVIPIVKLLKDNFNNLKLTFEISEDLNFNFFNNTVQNDGKNSNSIFSERKTSIPYRICPNFVKSEVFFTSYLDFLIPFTFYNNYILEFVLKLLDINNGKCSNNLKENNELTMLKYIGKDKILFGEVAYLLYNLREQIIPIGMYRNNLSNELGNLHHYVITNPNLNMYINDGDEVICIGKTSFFDKNNFDENNNTNKLKLFIQKNEINVENDSPIKIIGEEISLNLSIEDFF